MAELRTDYDDIAGTKSELEGQKEEFDALIEKCINMIKYKEEK